MSETKFSHAGSIQTGNRLALVTCYSCAKSIHMLFVFLAWMFEFESISILQLVVVSKLRIMPSVYSRYNFHVPASYLYIRYEI